MSGEQIYYYQLWNDGHSRLLSEFSDEMISICVTLSIDLSGVKSGQEYYEAPTPEKLTKKFHNIPSFQLLLLPMIKTDRGCIPDFASRYYTEDIPFGVWILKAFAQIAAIEMLVIDMIIKRFNAEYTTHFRSRRPLKN